MQVELALGALALLGLIALVLALGRSALVNSHASRLKALLDGGGRGRDGRCGWPRMRRA